MTTDAPPISEDARKPLWRSILAHVPLILLSIATIYPLLWMVSSSFKPSDEIFGNASLLSDHFTPAAYPRAWNSTAVSFGVYFMNSAIISVLSVVGNVLVCSIVAYGFARLRFRGKNFWFAIVLGTMMLPHHVTLVPQYVLFLNLGWVNTIWPLVVPKFLASDAFFIFLMVQFFRGLPRELDEAAVMDGCGPWRIYWKIIMPLSLPVMATAAVFTFIWTWDDFFGPLIYLNDVRTYTVQLALRGFVDASGESDFSGLFAMSVIAIIPVFLAFVFFQRLLIEGIATTGMKR
jgi:multiple sugar transport system permease protein